MCASNSSRFVAICHLPWNLPGHANSCAKCGVDRCLFVQAVQSEAAEPSSVAEALAMPALPAAQPAAPVMVHYTLGPDEGILQELDLAKAKPCLTRVTSFPLPSMLWSAQ